eukprot:2728536-Prymnesium_polylepis.1
MGVLALAAMLALALRRARRHAVGQATLKKAARLKQKRPRRADRKRACRLPTDDPEATPRGRGTPGRAQRVTSAADDWEDDEDEDDSQEDDCDSDLVDCVGPATSRPGRPTPQCHAARRVGSPGGPPTRGAAQMAPRCTEAAAPRIQGRSPKSGGLSSPGRGERMAVAF